MVKDPPANAGDTSSISTGGGRGTQETGNTCTHADDSQHCAAEANTVLLSDYIQVLKRV